MAGGQESPPRFSLWHNDRVMTAREFRRSTLPAAGLLCAALVLCPAFAPGLLAQEERFEGATEVVVVEVPVTVIHRGAALDGLAREDFTLYDRRQRQEIVSFERVLSAPGATLETYRGVPTPTARAARRNFLFFFDLAWADSRTLESTVGSLRGLLAGGLAEGDRVGVAFFSALRGFEWVVGLTDDRRDAEAALEVMEAILASDRARTRRLLADWHPSGRQLPTTALPDAGELIAEAGVSVHNRNASGWPTTSLLIEMARGLTTLADDTRELDGRKYLVHLSYGLPDWLVTGRSGERARVLGLLQDIKRAFRTSGWAIQSINLAGLGWGRDSLLMMAHDTGGELFTNSNDVAVLVQEMEATTRVTYLLTFQPRGLEQDGAFHPIEVEVRGLPRGARVLHRPGYYAGGG